MFETLTPHWREDFTEVYADLEAHFLGRGYNGKLVRCYNGGGDLMYRDSRETESNGYSEDLASIAAWQKLVRLDRLTPRVATVVAAVSKLAAAPAWGDRVQRGLARSQHLGAGRAIGRHSLR